MKKLTHAAIVTVQALAIVVIVAALLALVVNLQAPIVRAQSGVATFPAYQKLHVAAGTSTTTALTGAGVLHAVCVNTKGASSNLLTVYDSLAASGTVIGILDDVTFTGCMVYDVGVGIGITVASAAGTGADLTIVYRLQR